MHAKMYLYKIYELFFPKVEEIAKTFVWVPVALEERERESSDSIPHLLQNSIKCLGSFFF